MEKTYLDCLAEYGASGAHPGCLALTKRLIEKEEIHRNTRILDVGCGTGQTAAYLAKSYKAKVTALDLHPLMVEKAAKRLASEPVHVLQGSVEALPLSNASFDIVLAESVLAFTKTDQALTEIYRVLDQSGIMLAIEMVLETDLPQSERLQLQQFYGMPYLRSEAEWLQSIEKAGFRTTSVDIWHEDSKSQEPGMDETPEFILSEQISEESTDLLETHIQLKSTYEKELGTRIFRCCK